MADWRFVLCDRTGVAISNVTKIASSRAFAFRLNVPQRLSFTVPADDDRVARFHGDGYPKLDAGRRLVKAYRRERQADATEAYVLRYLGLVWQLQDTGRADDQQTAVSCIDPLVLLARRRCLSAVAGDPDPSKRVEFVNTDGALIAQTLLERTNAVAATGITVGTRSGPTPTRTVTLERRMVLDAMGELSGAFNGFDYELVPLDREDGILGRLDWYPMKGTNRAEAIFGWGIAPKNVVTCERLLNMEPVANVLMGLGATAEGGDPIWKELQDAGSIGAYGRLEGFEQLSDITSQAFLDALTSEALSFRGTRRELVQFVPQPDPDVARSPSPFDDFGLGDIVPLYVGRHLRGGFEGHQRIFGFDLVLDNEGREVVNAIYASPQA